ncbi:uncharacterized protein LOC106669454 isoform X2 [Cimex lectularius]|uniref:Uncharacterized protein n=1 Tax=Cimex lectularius TaxID=79782 RepID=A0A8I6RZE1_CIMLE|nr:uncharacterized protein LOC106669454 isoform X2 [Cimex lectularius]
MKKCALIDVHTKSVPDVETEEERWGAHLKQLETALKEFRDAKRNALELGEETLFPIEVSRWRVEWCKRPNQYRLDLSGISEGLPAIIEGDESEETVPRAFLDCFSQGKDYKKTKRAENIGVHKTDHPPEEFTGEGPIKEVDQEKRKAHALQNGDVGSKLDPNIDIKDLKKNSCLSSPVYIKSGNDDHEHKKTFWTKLRSKLHINHDSSWFCRQKLHF